MSNAAKFWLSYLCLIVGASLVASHAHAQNVNRVHMRFTNGAGTVDGPPTYYDLAITCGATSSSNIPARDAACEAIGPMLIPNLEAGISPVFRPLTFTGCTTTSSGQTANYNTATGGTTAANPGHIWACNITPPAAPPCSGLAAEGVGDRFTSDHSPGANGYCNAVSHCKMAVTSSVTVDGSTVYSIEHTDQNCANAAVPSPVGDDTVNGESCANGSGAEYCMSNQGENCGYVNDNFVCLPQVEADGCEVFGDTSRVCGTGAPTPPAPDNGTAGQPATPDEQIQVTNNTTNNTFNFFNSTTVSNSARNPGTSGDNPFDGEDDGEGSGGGVDDGEEEGSCPDGATCDGSLPDEFDEVCTFEECAEDFYTRVANAPMIAALESVDDSFPSGACPAVNIEMFDETMSLSEPICDIWTEQIAGAVSALMLIIFAWVATRVVLSA